MDPHMLTWLEIWMIEHQFLAAAFVCKRLGQQLAGSSRSNQYTSEAEHQAKAAAVQESLYLRSLLDEISVVIDGATNIKGDNQSCIKMYKNSVMQKRMKHIDVKY